MAKRVLDWKIQRFTNQSGSFLSNPNFVPFDFGSYGLTNVARFDMDISCVALESSEIGNSYPCHYIARVLYTWKKISGIGTGTVNATIYLVQNDSATFTWTTDTGGNGATSGEAGMFRVQGHTSGTRVWTVVCAARIVNFVEY